MKQAGLNLAEVRGKVGKSGYLEVALQPLAASKAGALREVSKIVDSRIWFWFPSVKKTLIDIATGNSLFVLDTHW